MSEEIEQDEKLLRMRNATLANLGSVGLGIIGGLLGNIALRAEIPHGLSDTGLHGSKRMAVKRGWRQDSKLFKLFLRGSMGILSFWAMGNTVNAADELVDQVRAEEVYVENTTKDHVLNVGGALGLAGLNLYAYTELKKIKKHDHASQSSFDHAEFDMVASLGLAAAMMLETAGVPYALEAGTAGFSAYTAYQAGRHAFKPHTH